MSVAKKNSPLKAIAILISGNVGVQALAFLASPFLSRLYSPIQFGEFGLFQTLSTIVLSISTLQLYQAIVVPKKDVDAYSLVLVCLLLVLTTSILILFGQLVIPGVFKRYFNISFNYFSAALFFLFIITSSVSLIISSWLIRKRLYAENIRIQVIKTIVTIVAQVILGFANYFDGLIVGFVLGSIVSSAILLLKNRYIFKRSLMLYSYNNTKQVLLRYRDFILFSLPQNFLNSMGQGLPVMFLQKQLALVELGQYSFARKIMNVPFNAISSSMRQVLLKEISDRTNSGSKVSLILGKYVKMTFLGGIIPVLLGYYIFPILFPYVFGDEWKFSGLISSWLLIWMFPGIMSVASTVAARVIGKQRVVLLLEAISFCFRYISMILIKEAHLKILVFCVIGCIFNILMIIAIYLKVKKKERIQKNSIKIN